MSSPPFKVKAVYDYKSPHEDDLSFPVGQIITVTEEEDADWYVGEYIDAAGTNQDGLFPRNFVEKYEPSAPPRPSRPRHKKDPGTPAEAPRPAENEHAPTPEHQRAVEPTFSKVTDLQDEPATSPSMSKVEQPGERKPQPPSPATAPAPAMRTAPPPAAEKPSSFKDRIAAFNKPSAPPVPSKPAGPPSGGGSSFIKKPFVAPPPSKDAYIPPPRQPGPQKVYRREEDPEIAERQAQDLEGSEKAGLTGGVTATETTEEEPPKQTSLKDRIAILQKQQQEQAARRAELAAKEKPPKPPTKRTESGSRPTEQEYVENDSESPGNRTSYDTPREAPKPPSRSSTYNSKLPVPALAESISDGNEADQSGAGETTEDAGGTSTEVEEGDEKTKPTASMPPSRAATGSSRREQQHDLPENEAGPEEEGEEEDEMDPEERRKMELRARMAKMSGGMGMAGMFGGGMPMSSAPPKKAKSSAASHEANNATLPPATQRIPMVPAPGIPSSHSPTTERHELNAEQEPQMSLSSTAERPLGEPQDVEELEPQPSARSHGHQHAPPVTQERPLPPPPPTRDSRAQAPPVPRNRPVPTPGEARAVPPPPPTAPRRQSDGAESDEDISPPQRTSSGSKQFVDGRSIPGAPPPIPGLNTNVSKSDEPKSPSSSTSKRVASRPFSPPPIPSSPPSHPDKRASRVPSIPIASPNVPSINDRPPPPPPPTTAPPSRKSTEVPSHMQEESEGGESDYEGDYDTDIASGAPHKDALKSHARESSLDETILSEGPASRSGSHAPSSIPPSIPIAARAVPPPPLHQAPQSRKSTDVPRVPPPIPPLREPTSGHHDDDEYDPFRYGAPISASRKQRMVEEPIQESDPSLYSISPQTTVERAPPMAPRNEPQQKHAVPPPLPPEHTSPPLPPPEARQSTDLPRRSVDPSRRSMTGPRASTDLPQVTDGGYIAREVDLAGHSLWFTHPTTPPPIFQNRNDVLCEFEEATTSKRGGRTTIARDVYVLFPDYSQTIINARYDPKEPSPASLTTILEQRHDPPPPRPRQDELEAAHAKFGEPLATAVSTRQNTTVGDASPQALIVELLHTVAPNALLPVGMRGYGACIYANMANASVQLHDEIRPGDIVTLRNAKFSGKHGAMHAKYTLDVKEHVGVVAEWDGSKKKIRAWEQGRDGIPGKEGKKVRFESWKVGDLRSGEVRVWRVVGRDWVGWEGSN